MQPPLQYSWIALTAASPVILILTCWTLAVFHCRRQSWTTMDVFLVSILSQSIIQQFLGFIYSILVLIKLSAPLTGETVCTGMMWFFIAIPIFKGTTIASLALDRWLFYTRFSYRISIRKSHIRYHVAVLLLFCCLIPFNIDFNSPELLVANSQASSSLQSQYSFDQCTFLPFKFDLKFVIFYLSVHCIVILFGAIILCKSSCHKNSSNANHSQLIPHHQAKKLHYKRRRRSSPLDVTPTLSNTSTASSTISNSSPTNFFSTPGLTAKIALNASSNNAYCHNQSKIQKMDFPDRTKIDDGIFRLGPALGLMVITILLTHLPFVMATILSRMDIFQPVPSIGFGSGDKLSLFNWPLTNVLLWLQVVEGLGILLVLVIMDNIIPILNRGKKSIKENNTPHSYAVDASSTNIKIETSFHPNSPNNLNNASSSGNAHYNPGYVPDIKNNKFPISNGSLFGPTLTSFPGVRHATCFQGHSSNGESGSLCAERHSRSNFDSIRPIFQEDESEYDRKSYHHRYASVASVTTVANDDFEFHQSRPSIFQRPQHPIENPNKDYNSSTYVVPKSQPQILKLSSQASTSKKILDKDTRHKQSHQNVYEESAFWPQPSTSFKPHTSVVGLNQPTSLSMNDLDLIDDQRKTPTKTQSPSTPEPYENKQRMYRKRARLNPHQPGPNERRGGCNKPSSGQFSNDRRVLSMECLPPQSKQTEHRNVVDISYMDTGEILLRKADSSKCIFVTDFI